MKIEFTELFSLTQVLLKQGRDPAIKRLPLVEKTWESPSSTLSARETDAQYNNCVSYTNLFGFYFINASCPESRSHVCMGTLFSRRQFAKFRIFANRRPVSTPDVGHTFRSNGRQRYCRTITYSFVNNVTP